MKKIKSVIIMLIAICSISCSSCSKETATKKTGKNFLSFKVNNVLWESDEDEVWGSYHANESFGNRLLQITGGKGEEPNDASFIINISETDAEDTYTFNQDNVVFSSAQLMQPLESDLLCGGGAYDYDFTVVVTKVSKTPQIVEATFNGTMSCSSRGVVNITDGKFYYHE